MRNYRWLIPIILLALALLAVSAGATGAQTPSYHINQWTYGASAGDTSASASYTLRGTLGQQAVTSLAGLTSTVTGGIWCGISGGPITIYLPLVALNYSTAPPFHEVEDAPDDCPGYTVEIAHHYGEDFDWTNDNDWWELTVQEGVTYTLHTFDLRSRADTILYLYDADCATELAQNDDAQAGTAASRIVWEAPAAGTYHAMVRHWDWQVYGADTGYTFAVAVGESPLEPLSVAVEVSGVKPPSLPTPNAERQ
jgi:hypothetical protein